MKTVLLRQLQQSNDQRLKKFTAIGYSLQYKHTKVG